MGSIVRSITRAPKKVFKGVKKLAKSPLAPIAAGIFGPAALAAMGPGTFGGAGFLGSMGARAGLSNLIAQALSGESIDAKSAALSGLTSQLGSMSSGARDTMMAGQNLPTGIGTDTSSMLGQAKDLGIRAAGAVGDYVAPQDFKSMTGSGDLVTNLKNIGSNIGKVGAATAINPGTAQVMIDLNQQTIDNYNNSLIGDGMKDRGSRRNAIYEIYMNTGAYEEDEVNAMLDKYGYAQGGIIGLKEGGFMDQLRDSLSANTLTIEDLIARQALGTSLSDVPEIETDSETTIEEVKDEDGNTKFILKTNEDFGEDLTSGLGGIMQGAEMAYGRPFGEMAPTEMMRFKKGGKVIPIMPDNIRWKGKAKDYPGAHEVIKQNRKKKTGPGVQKKAEGGIMSPEEYFQGKEKHMKEEQIENMRREYKDYIYKQKNGPRDEAAKGGIMNKNLLNTGMDKDMRVGGFIPEGTKEKADDVPARLSKNEFVMTADAVKAAGGGSINKGAKRMYQLMNNLQGKR